MTVFNKKEDQRTLAINAFSGDSDIKIDMVCVALDAVLESSILTNNPEILAKLYFIGLAILAKYKKKIETLLQLSTFSTLHLDGSSGDRLAALRVLFSDAARDMYRLFPKNPDSPKPSYTNISIDVNGATGDILVAII
jgi:hypothetical protein